MGKPVVVSRTAAIAEGYELEDGVNCRLVEPGDEQAFERALLEMLTGAAAARSLGSRARQTVERSFSWERFTDALWEVLVSVLGGHLQDEARRGLGAELVDDLHPEVVRPGLRRRAGELARLAVELDPGRQEAGATAEQDPVARQRAAAARGAAPCSLTDLRAP